ncbi:DUF4398 domain-containing protein [Bdellovibrio sp. HCB337]|uniref:DUF4398 domain-containing protein n=1 Tax=Bdellovibrio sp. HCB337 TaxID=3394358 RepID=UPI0039A65B07
MRGIVAVAVTLVMLLVGCQTVSQPIEEYSLARAAIEAARAVQAPRHSPGYWHQADEAYRQGRLAYKDRNYSKARDAFLKAKMAAEKAENSARLIRQKTGDVL